MFRRLVPIIGFIVAGLWAGLGSSPVWAQVNIDQGKSAAEIFNGDCGTCHKSAKGLANGRNSGALAGFLREHYTSSAQQASSLAAYVLGAGGGPAPSGNLKPGTAGAEAKPGEAKPGEAKPAKRAALAARSRRAQPSCSHPPNRTPRLKPSLQTRLWHRGANRRPESANRARSRPAGERVRRRNLRRLHPSQRRWGRQKLRRQSQPRLRRPTRQLRRPRSRLCPQLPPFRAQCRNRVLRRALRATRPQALQLRKAAPPVTPPPHRARRRNAKARRPRTRRCRATIFQTKNRITKPGS